jgi:hypothetical protein
VGDIFRGAKNTKIDFTDIAMLTGGVEVGRKERSTSVVNTMKK